MTAASSPPKKIISMVPSITELLVHWGLAARLAGRTSYCVEPAWIQASIPAVGGPKSADIQAMLALEPDLVILEKSENCLETAKALETAAVPLCILDIPNLQSCLDAFETLGRVLQAEPQATISIFELKKRLHSNPRPDIPTLCMIWKSPWMMAGPGTYVADVLEKSGFRVLGPRGYAQMTEADLRAIKPHCIIFSTDPYPFDKDSAAGLIAQFPKVQWTIQEGKHLTWCLSRSAEGLDALRHYRKNLRHDGRTVC